MDTENPVWPDQILLEYKFETMQQVWHASHRCDYKYPVLLIFRSIGQVIIKLYDQDGGYDQTRLEKHQFIGECQFALTDIMCAPGQKYSVALQGGRRRCDYTI